MSQTTQVSKRIEALDYLRGFFILVIIVDHMWRWPNLFQFVSGRGELWVSAAEGFVMISGLLVGYVRGRKGLKKSFGEISKKLISRGLMLYIWAFITTVALVAATWYLTFRSNIANVPYAKFDWANVLRDTLTMNYTHTLSHFLYLYAIFLVISPLFVWLLRKNQWWIGAAFSLFIWGYGYIFSVEWMQWQLLFFLPATAGFYLDQIIAFFRHIPPIVIKGLVGISVVSIVVSAYIALPNAPGFYHSDLFAKEPMSLMRVALAFVWFSSLAWVFNRFIKLLERSVGWLLIEFGTRSLTAYIVHSLPVMLISLVLPNTSDFWISSLLIIVAILSTWAILKIPNINRIIPR
jgi:hypothetical protein